MDSCSKVQTSGPSRARGPLTAGAQPVQPELSAVDGWETGFHPDSCWWSDRMSRGNYLAAALSVLASTGSPMTAREITEEALRRGLIQSVGKTPKATMSARLYVEVRDNPHGGLVRLAEPGPTPARARRGSVRWAIRSSAAETS